MNIHQLTIGPTGSGKTDALHADINEHDTNGDAAWLCALNDADNHCMTPKASMVGTSQANLFRTMLLRAVEIMEHRQRTQYSERTEYDTIPVLLAVDDLDTVLNDRIEGHDEAVNQLRALLRNGQASGIRVHATAVSTEQIPGDVLCQLVTTDLAEKN